MPNANRDERHRYRTASPMSASPPPSSSPTSSVLSSAAPLSANDRRERNKAASAKYRAKKHYQSGEMRSQITVLQDQNNVITRQLEECRAENASLKNMVEKLKGRLVAEKVLKRLREVGREKKRRGSGAGHAAKVSAQDLAVSDSEVDDDDDDVVDAVEKAVEDDDEEGIEENDAVLAGIEKRSSERKAHSRRRAVRTNDDDEDYRED
ncbi:hypothetical protein BGZ54_007172 [Gamsiella multidivaricata]|nr:hypothetical protein BGZ54_007172 [Gamsiella multidivaricata]